MASTRSANTPTELWPKVINSVGDVKLSVAENGMQKYSRDLTKAVQIETEILKHLGEPVEQMLGGFQAPPSAGPNMLTPGQGMGGAAMAGGAPNMDEMRRMLNPG